MINGSRAFSEIILECSTNEFHMQTCKITILGELEIYFKMVTLRLRRDSITRKC